MILGNELSMSVQGLIRISYGIFLVLFLAALIRNHALYFSGEKWKGYIFSSKIEDITSNPFFSRLLPALWFVSVVLMTAGVQALFFSFINMLFCRYYFIHLRWKSLSRGCGAPGFLSQWLSVCVFLLELTSLPGLDPWVRASALFLLRIDFAAIILSAGFYKFFSGYRHNEGMEYGLVNPMWGYYPKTYSRMNPHSVFFRILNHLAWGTEILAGFLMLIPSFMEKGATLLALSFAFIASHIRLAWLCHMVIIACMVYARPDGILSRIAGSFDLNFLNTHVTTALISPEYLNFLTIFFIAQAFLLPFCYLGIWCNHLLKKKLPGALQSLLDLYANWFGVIIWRVFVKDLTEFIVDISAVSGSGQTRQISEYGVKRGWTGNRYSFVAESIVAASLFTTLNYFPDNKELLFKKLRSYSATVAREGESGVIFKLRRILKGAEGFEEKAWRVYEVDMKNGSIRETLLNDFPSSAGPTLLMPGRKPGSYAP